MLCALNKISNNMTAGSCYSEDLPVRIPVKRIICSFLKNPQRYSNRTNLRYKYESL